MTDSGSRLTIATDTAINRAQRDYWESEGPRQYQEFGEVNDALLAPFGQAMLEAAGLQPGERVLDVGCGHGASTFEAAEQVAPSGRVVGIDISAAMLEPARRRVATTGVDNIEFVDADAQVHAFETGSFDVVLSRFGAMFFEDPHSAFANFSRTLRPAGRLVFVCPQDPRNSEWIALAFGAAAAVLGGLPDPGPAGSPGTFALADRDRLEQMLSGAGFREVTLETVTRPVRLGSRVDDTVEFILSLRESKQLFTGAPQATLEAAAAALRAAFAPYAGPAGVVADATAWLVSAHS
jgi:ubiquinone/menaquinone biosynthesis C-methylase UbiE